MPPTSRPADGNNLAVGDHVVYRAPVSLEFSSAQVDVDLVPRNRQRYTTVQVPKTNADGSTAHNPDANNIYVGSASYGQLGNGDALNYTARSTGTIGLTSGTTYYVIKSSTDNVTIQLAASYCLAVGEAGDSANCAGIAVTALPLIITGADVAAHQLDRALGSLVDGNTYYVTSVDATTGAITLASSPFGAPLNVDALHRSGEHRIGLLEVDLQIPSSTGQQALFANLTTACVSGCGRLLAPSGQPLSTVSPPVGDGISAASATGGTGGLLADFAFPVATLSGTPSVSATVAGTLTAGLDIVVIADSQVSVTSSADTFSGAGFIAVGRADSSADLTSGGGSPTTLGLYGSITAGRDITATATIDHSISSSARSYGGSGIAGGRVAYSHAWINDDLTITIGNGAMITAGRALSLTVDAKNSGSDNAQTYTGSAVGSGSDSNNTSDDRGLRVGSFGDHVQRGITVGAGSSLTGGTVSLFASVTLVNLSANATATAFAAILLGVATAYSNALVDIYSDTYVTVNGPNTVISGAGGVDLRARQDNLTVTRQGGVLAVALIPPQQLYLQGTDSYLTTVTTGAGVTVTAGARGTNPAVQPVGSTVALDVEAANSTPVRNFYHDVRFDTEWQDNTGQANTSTIVWDADVIVLGGIGGGPVLVVGADGTVLAANGVLVGGVAPVVGSKLPAGPITLSPISVSGSGDVYMNSGNSIVNGTSTGTAAKPWPIFDFRTTVAGVRLVNLSPYALDIGGIDVVLAPSNTLPLVKLTPNGGNPTGFKTSATLQFDLRRTAGSSYLDLEQRSDTAQDLVISGPINNPLGLTRLVNLNGSITGSGLITTQQLDVYAPNGSVGTPATPLQIDLVRYASQGPVGGPPLGTVVDPRLVVDVSGDGYLSLRGVDRATPAATSMTLYIDSITVGGLADLTLRTSAAQSVGTRSADVNAQVVQESSLWAAPRPHSSHFRGTNSTVRAEYDPGYTAGGTPDPTQPIGAGTSISTSVVFGLRNTVLPRVQVPGVGGDHYAAATAVGGGYTLFSDVLSPPQTPGLSANGITLYDSYAAINPNRPDDGSPYQVSLRGVIDPDVGKRIPYGLFNANVAGDITLVIPGNATIGKVTSRTGDVMSMCRATRATTRTRRLPRWCAWVCSRRPSRTAATTKAATSPCVASRSVSRASSSRPVSTTISRPWAD